MARFLLLFSVMTAQEFAAAMRDQDHAKLRVLFEAWLDGELEYLARRGTDEERWLPCFDPCFDPYMDLTLFRRRPKPKKFWVAVNRASGIVSSFERYEDAEDYVKSQDPSLRVVPAALYQ